MHFLKKQTKKQTKKKSCRATIKQKGFLTAKQKEGKKEIKNKKKEKTKTTNKPIHN